MNSSRIYTGISLIIGILSIAVPTYFSIEQSKEKSLAVEEKGRQDLFLRSIGKPAGLTLALNGKPVTTPWALTLSYENSGKIPIQKAEIESPIAVNFKKSNVIDAQISGKSPSNISASIDSSLRTVRINHDLLNPGDKIQINILLDGPSENPTIEGRVSDISKIEYSKYSPETRNQEIISTPIKKTAQAISIVLLLLAGLGLFLDFYKKILKKRHIQRKSI